MINSVPLVILNRADVDGLLHDIERETGFELDRANEKVHLVTDHRLPNAEEH